MRKIINFLIEAGKIKTMRQRGFVFRKVKDPTSVASHGFREAVMAWLLGHKNRGLNLEKLFKIILAHDIFAGLAGDITPYEPFLPKRGLPKKEVFEKWARSSQKEKERFFLKKRKKEWQVLTNLTKNLPSNLKYEIIGLWNEYEKGLTAEGRFIQQIDMLENLLQALEYWKRDKKFPIKSWWHQMKELIYDPTLLEFLEELDKKFHQDKK